MENIVLSHEEYNVLKQASTVLSDIIVIKDDTIERLRIDLGLEKIECEHQRQLKLSCEIALNSRDKQIELQQKQIAELKDAIQYYFDVLSEVRGSNWNEKPDHVLAKMLTAMNK